jgi:signal peptidase II
MTSFARLAILLITTVACVGCDQVTKAVARGHLVSGNTLSFLHDTVRLKHVENPGAFLGMGDALPATVRAILFTFGGAVLLAGAILWTVRSRHMSPIQTLGAALACSGGLGNLIDRFSRQGQVTDFLNIGIGSLRTGIFNVADFAMLVGVAMVALSASRDAGGARTPKSSS